MDTPVFKPKRLVATITLTLPAIDADSQSWQTHNVGEMARLYQKQIEENLIEVLEGPYEEDTVIINTAVEILESEKV